MTKVIHSWRAERQGNNVDNRIFHSMLCYELLKIVAYLKTVCYNYAVVQLLCS